MSHILILGGDGYLGWPSAMYFSNRGHEVTVVDNYFRRNACTELDVGMLSMLFLHFPNGPGFGMN